MYSLEERISVLTCSAASMRFPSYPAKSWKERGFWETTKAKGEVSSSRDEQGRR